MALERQQRISAIDSSPDPLKLYLTTFPSFRLNRKNIINVSLKYSATPLTYAHFQVFLKIYLLLFYVRWSFVWMYVCVMVPDPLELEFKTVVSCHMGARN